MSTMSTIWSHLLKKSLMENFIFCAVCAGEDFHSLIVRGKFFVDIAITPENVERKNYETNQNKE